MNAHTNGRLNRARLTPTLPVAPVTRAIRAALAISATLLALGGTGTAIAQGACTFTTPTTVTCEGGFTNTLPDPTFFTPVTDLTLVLGDNANSVPTSVTTTAGLMGIDANWGGSVGVTSYADITTVGATGIFAYSATTATVNNQGSVTTDVAAYGAKAIDVNAYGDVNVVNNGAVSAYSTGVYDVTAVSAISSYGNVSVDNQAAGTITATGQDGNAIALYASGYGVVTVTNEGAIVASSVYGVAEGIVAHAYNGNASVINSGSITATSTVEGAFGINASSSNGYASVTNSGSVTVTSAQDQAIGIEAFGQTGSSVYNSGSVTATADSGAAIGILAHTVNDNATITNTGSVTATSGYNAIGLSAISENGDASATNSGHIQAIGHGGLTSGIETYTTVGNTDASNSGYIVSGSYGGSAVGVSAGSGGGNATVSNASGGYVRVVTTEGATSYATGISAKTYNGDATASNGGTVVAESSFGEAIGVNVSASGGNASATNTGTIEASNSLFNKVRGIQAISSTGEATVTNSGEILATSNEILGYPFSVTTVDGIGAQGYTGSTVTNSGYVKAVGPWFVNGIEGISLYGSAAVTNTSTGKIVAIGLQPTGISTSVGYLQGQAVVNNAGDIVILQEGDCHCGGTGLTQYGTGIYAFSNFASGVQVTNSGSISVNTQHGAWGINAITFNDAASVTNTGSIAVATTGYNAVNFGISATSAYGTTSVVNSGDIAITTGSIPNVYHPENDVVGIFAETGRHHLVGYGAGYYGAGDTTVSNTGNISIVNAVGGIGIHAVAEYGSALVSNSGHITIDDSLSGWGIFANTYSVSGTASVGDVVDNAGTITVAGPEDARGIEALSSGTTAGATITNTGDIALSATGDDAYGVFVRNYAYGTNTSKLTVNNSGTISASNVAGSAYVTGTFRGAQADGIRIFDYANDAIVYNTGSITASESGSFSAGSAIGVLVHNGYGGNFGTTNITNAGSIVASVLSTNSTSSFHAYYAHGAFAGGVVAAATYGDVTVTNTGSITATATGAYNTGAGLTTADGISVISKVGNSASNSFNLGNIKLTNDGANASIVASAESTEGTGAAVANGIAALVSFGSYGGSLVSQGFGITVNNSGVLSATALVDTTAQGSASAYGISAINGSPAGFVSVTNSGTITTAATTPGAATATGIFASGYSVAVALNKGSAISAVATGASGTATGLSLINTGTGPLITNNDGVLTASFIGAGQATGAMITSAGDVTFSNTGQIQANNATSATGVAFNSPTTITLTNSGTITANSAAAGSVALLSTGASNDTFNNSGMINGAIQTGAGDDVLNNAGTWNAVGASDFGAGDDTVSNTGTIHLSNTTISLGSDPAGNQFSNSGVITVLGNNTITMDTGTPASPNPFTNTGTINFQNGLANNTLTIAGNFAGNGQLDMDVNGAQGTADALKITGSVVPGSVSTVNVNLLSDPTTASSVIPLVQVGGSAAAGAFVLGTFTQPKSFLGLSEALVNTPNTTALGLTVAATTPPPVVTPPPTGVGVGVTVTGLSQLGTLAASAAPGVQSLMNSQIGTLEDRMGAVSQTIKGGLSLWTRAFADSGTVDPDHSAGNFGQNGNFGFDQSNTGEEVGLDFAISDAFKAGALFAKSRANQSLDGNQADSSQISGNTAGVYATWIDARGLYVDASYRWMSFNDRLHAPNGYASIHGNADAFNVEVGKTWTVGNGLQIAPQFQYTLTKVDNINAQTGGLAGFQSTGDDASRARLGVMFSKNYTPASSNAVWMPYASLSAVTELDGKNSYAVNNTFFGETDTKGTSVLAETGLNVQLGKLAVFGGLNWQDGGALKSFFGGQVGLRYTF